jgi:hypothetical protein
MTINDAVKMWPTPTSRDHKDGTKHRVRCGKIQTDTLGRAVQMWPTLTSISPAKNGYNEAGNSCGLVAIRERISGEDSQATGQLSPIFVEWLMGFPLGWTDLEDSETQ